MEIKSLRALAETEILARVEAFGTEPLPAETVEATRERLQYLLHEMQVYEQELEIQNQELRESQSELENSRNRFADLFDFSPVGYLVLDERGIVKEANLTVARMLDRERDTLLGFPLIHFVAAQDRQAFLAHLGQCRRRTNDKITIELRLIGVNRVPLPVELYSVPDRDASLPRRIRTAVCDITERRRAQEALQKAKRELEQRVDERTAELRKTNDALLFEVMERGRLQREICRRMRELAQRNRHKDEFLAMLSHELRNPLAAIANAGELLGRPEAHSPDTVDRLGRLVRNQCRHLKALLNDLLDVARITQGKIVLHKGTVDLAEIVNGAVESTRGLIDARDHHLAVTLPPAPVYLDVDRARCMQIVGNLLNNAAKFTNPGGEISLSAVREGDFAVIQVCDNGAGISPELLPRVFDFFTQEDRSLAHSSGGLGIGLALVKQLAEMHGGDAAAASPGPGRGSEFTVRLPASAEPSEPRNPTGEPSPEDGARVRRILIVDDNVDYADSLRDLLEAYDYEAHACYEGRVALQLARQFRPDAAVVDIGMPDMDGYEFARRLRAEADLKDVRLIAISGYGANDDRSRSLAAGFDRHLVKPVDIVALRSLLRQKPSASNL